MNNTHLFIFTIGPVKSFIRESRKTQDIFAGSALLSKLCQKAIQKAEEIWENDFKCITPNTNTRAEKLSYPNRFTAIVKNTVPEDLPKKATAIAEKVQGEFAKLPSKITLSLGAKEQLANHLDIRWVFQPLHNDYKKTFIAANQHLAAIKNYNPLSPLTETGRKCIVDGKRNVKFYRETAGKQKQLFTKDITTLDAADTDDSPIKIWQLERGEGISAVTLRKRLFDNEAHNFPSTAKVALFHIFDHFTRHPSNAFEHYQHKVEGKNKNGKNSKWLDHSNDQLYYQENISLILEKEKEFINDWEGKKSVEELTELIQNKHTFWSKGLNLPFTKYYALIRFDGDKMGDLFGGKYCKEGTSLQEFQSKLSGKIMAFANSIQQEIKEPYGKVVYAGGEDFMAFVNLHQLKEVVNTIQKKFQEHIAKGIEEDITQKNRPTLSMGITIAHYKEPLQMVLDKTAQAEKAAKEQGRNRFAITISKHSGTQSQMVMPWEHNNWETLWNLIDRILKKRLSSAFLRNTYDYIMDSDLADSKDKAHKEFIQSRIKLYVKRAKTSASDQELEDSITKLHQFLAEGSIQNFADSLLVMDFLQRKTYA